MYSNSSIKSVTIENNFLQIKYSSYGDIKKEEIFIVNGNKLQISHPKNEVNNTYESPENSFIKFTTYEADYSIVNFVYKNNILKIFNELNRPWYESFHIKFLLMMNRYLTSVYDLLDIVI